MVFSIFCSPKIFKQEKKTFYCLPGEILIFLKILLGPKWATTQIKIVALYSDAASGWTGWALAHPKFGISVNPTTTRGADYAHHITASPSGFENPAAPLL